MKLNQLKENNTMKPICFIGARGGSKGVPKKNIKKLNGKPLIAYSIESAISSKLFSHVIVSTDDKKIASVAREFGAEVPFLRPKRLATDSIGFDAVLLHGIKELFSLGYKFEIIVNRDCTAPFLQNRDIEASINLLKKKNADLVIGVYLQHLNPYFNMLETNSKGFLELVKKSGKRPRSRQESPPVYQMNGLYTYNVKQFLKYKKILLPKTLPHIIPPETGLMIDTKLEFQIIELIMKNKLDKFFSKKY